MNRVAVWILGSISGLLMFLGVWSFTIFGAAVGESSSCESFGNQPCTPVIQQVTVSSPQLGGPAPFVLAMLLLAVLIGLPAWIATPLLALRRGSSARTAIVVVAIIATALLVVLAVVIPIASATVFQAPQVCTGGFDTGSQSQTCYTGAQAFWVGLVGISWGPLATALLVGAPAWVMTLTQTARLRQWGWFVAALFLSPVAALLYALLGDRRRGQPAAPVAPAAPATPASPAPAAG